MDITLLSEKSIRIKSKSASLVVNPTSTISKTEAEGVLMLEKNPTLSSSKVEGSRISINGQGEYEVGGIKVSAIQVGDRLVANIEADGVRVLVGDGQSVEKIHEKVEGSDITLIDASEEFNYSSVSSLEQRVLLVYGLKKEEVGKSLGKSDVATVSKFSVTRDKLPEEMQLILLG